MAKKTTRSKELKGMGYEMFIGALSILSIAREDRSNQSATVGKC
jgi:hypothetical protein